MGQFGMGQPVRRVEDPRLITGRGRYTDDISVPAQGYAVILRSPHAHARIAALDTATARAMPGVRTILTADDLADIGPLPCPITLSNRDGSKMAKPLRPVLAGPIVRHVGDPVAFIVADTLDQARDAAEAIAIDYVDLPAIAVAGGDLAAALDPAAPQVWPEAPNNLCMDWQLGDEAAVAAAFDRAAHRVQVTLVNNRLVSNPMEPRNALAEYRDGHFTLTTSSQGVHSLRDSFAKMLHVPAETIRVITPDVGGGFGTKIFPYPEQVLALIAARQTGRPVKWTGERSDCFLADAHGRDNLTTATMAVDDQGRFLALSVETLANLGAYLSYYGPFVPTLAGTQMLVGVYDIPAAHVRVRGLFTHTVPVDAYRGAGRPEAAYVIERLVEAVARHLNLDSAEIRRRNFITPAQMPYQTALGSTYDSGDFARNLDDALALGHAASFAERRQQSHDAGKLRGLGLATYIEACSGGGDERAIIRFDTDGRVEILIGTQSNGQGHATAYAQIAADRLGLPIDAIIVRQGDTGLIPTGKGTGGSRSVPVGGAAVRNAADRVIDKAKRLAADYLEAAIEDIEFADGLLTIAGTDRQIHLTEIARRAILGEVPADETPMLDGTDVFLPPQSTYPNGCHLVEIEIDPETGATELLAYTVVDDFGYIVNPLLLAGQVHGGIAQGVGQALLEACVYDRASGQLLTGSLTDYALPRADLLPPITFATNIVPCTTNLLGIKGAGEAGAIGATPAVINAVLDALSSRGIRHIDMPATPQRIWSALHQSRGQA